MMNYRSGDASPRHSFTTDTASVESFSNSSTSALLVLCQRYRIRLCAQNLPTKRFFQAPDTFAVVTTIPNADSAAHTDVSSDDSTKKPSSIADRVSSSATTTTSASVEVAGQQHSRAVISGRTEVICSSRHPQWTTTILLHVYPGEASFFYVHIFEKSDTLTSFGTVLFHTSDILSNPRRTRVKRLRSGGCIFCRLEKISKNHHDDSNLGVTLQFQAKDISVKHSMMELATQSDAGWLVIHRTQPVFDSASPTYDAFTIDLESLCGRNPDCPLRCSVYSVPRRRGSHHRRRKLLAIAETTFRVMRGEIEYYEVPDDVSHVDPHMELQLVQNASIYKAVGKLKVLQARIHRQENFSLGSSSELRKSFHLPQVVEIMDLQTIANQPKDFAGHIQDGLTLDFCVAIDFTSSNGNPLQDKENSYHYLNLEADTMNDYEETIAAIGPVIDKYSPTREYPVWGFGAKFDDVVRDIFQCGSKLVAKGVDGILQAYRSVFQSDLIMSGPTNFTQVIQMAASRAAGHHKSMLDRHGSKQYTVLLIITDGCMHNYEATRQLVQAYSCLPLSIVFVGVGRSDFGLLHQLAQEPCNRSITCVAEFRKFEHAPSALGEAALCQLPAQICEYMRMMTKQQRMMPTFVDVSSTAR